MTLRQTRVAFRLLFLLPVLLLGVGLLGLGGLRTMTNGHDLPRP